jgi:hypothetical protein
LAGSSRAKQAEKHLAGKTRQPIFAVPKNEAKLAIGRRNFNIDGPFV